ncbi:DUF1652 domain-containing protein [Pseudomonas syringae]|uniref:DUF1652 domain-containing protein n=1 Tax=Pseudomonas syringae TaxID=317 RepID=UPI003F75160E
MILIFPCLSLNVKDTIAPDASMTIQIFNQDTEHEEFTTTGIDALALVTIRDIVALVLEV